MKKISLLSPDNMVKKNKKYQGKKTTSKNLLLEENRKDSLSFYRSFSLNNIKIKSNNKQSIKIYENKKRKDFSPKNKVQILENNILIFKNGDLFNSLNNLANIKKQKFALQKKIENISNNIRELKLKSKNQSVNKYLIKNDQEQIKRILENEEQNNLKIQSQLSEDDISLNILKLELKKEEEKAKENKNIFNDIINEIIVLEEKIKKINKKNWILNKENDNLKNNINEYKRKNEYLKKEINKYENLSNQLLNDVKGLINLNKSN